MGKTHLRYFEQNICYVCAECHTEITLPSHIESKVGFSFTPKSFRGSTGTAYLFNKIINYQLGKIEQKMLSTGLHTIQDVHCLQCDFLIGWHYVAAQNQSNNYKIGKSCIERALIKRIQYDSPQIPEDAPISEMPTPLWVQSHQNPSYYPVNVPPSSFNQVPELQEEEQEQEEEEEEEEAVEEEEIEYEAYIQQQEPIADEDYIEESEEQVYTEEQSEELSTL